MDDTQKTIGLSNLLQEIDRDLDELRKKHSSDFNVRNIAMWWELERERVLARHVPQTLVKKLRKVQSFKRMMVWFFSGWLTMAGITTILWLLLP